jgi:hypothetical protein
VHLRFLPVLLAVLLPALDAAGAPAPPAAPRRPRLGVTGFIAPDLSDQAKAALEEVVAQAAAGFSKMDVVAAADVRALLNLSQMQQMTGCNEAHCLTEFGDVLAVQQMVSGSVRKVGNKYAVNLLLHDLVNSRTLKRSSAEVDATTDALLPAVRQGVAVLFGVVGQVRIWDQPRGAEVFVDDALLGTTPIEVVTVRTPGKHQISIQGPGVTPWRQEVDVAAGADLRLRALNRSVADLEVQADSRRSRAWVLGAVGFLGALGAGVLWGLARNNDKQLDSLDRRTASQAQLDEITGRSFTLVLSSAALGAAALAFGGAGIYSAAVNPAEDALAANRAAAR